MVMTKSMKLLLCIVAVLALMTRSAYAQLSPTFYQTRCSNLTNKVTDVVQGWIKTNRPLAPALLRLFFHDCFVNGCDGSVLLDGLQGEKEAAGNKNSLRGFNIIDDVKAKVEAMCPGVVSCADILALSARDAMAAVKSSTQTQLSVITFGGITWTVNLGRRDGLIASKAQADADLPPPFANITQLKTMFARKNLTPEDLTILSGAHSVGETRCATMQSRLYSFSPLTPTDFSLDPTFVNTLKRQCKQGDQNSIIRMDQTKATDTWDFNFYSNVIKGRAVFQSDDALKRDPNLLKVVQAQNRAGGPFNSNFQAAMVKLGSLGVLTGTRGQIRRKCNVIN